MKTPLEKASDPETTEEELRALELTRDPEVRRALASNPSLPFDIWHALFLSGWPEAFASTRFLLHMLDQQDPSGVVREPVRIASISLYKEPGRLKGDALELFLDYLDEWYLTDRRPLSLLRHVGLMAEGGEKGSPAHVAYVKISLRIARSYHGMKGQFRSDVEKVTSLFDAWTEDPSINVDTAVDMARDLDNQATKESWSSLRKSLCKMIFCAVDCLDSSENMDIDSFSANKYGEQLFGLNSPEVRQIMESVLPRLSTLLGR